MLESKPFFSSGDQSFNKFSGDLVEKIRKNTVPHGSFQK
jgi:hypothetical protein